MIWCVDHEAQRRNMEIYTLRCVGMDAKGYDNAESFWEDLHKRNPMNPTNKGEITYEKND